jgi:hypothetical protein
VPVKKEQKILMHQMLKKVNIQIMKTETMKRDKINRMKKVKMVIKRMNITTTKETNLREKVTMTQR